MNEDLFNTKTDDNFDVKQVSCTVTMKQHQKNSNIGAVVREVENDEISDTPLTAPCTSKDSEVQEKLVKETTVGTVNNVGKVIVRSENDKSDFTSKEPVISVPKTKKDVKKPVVEEVTKITELKEKQKSRKRPPMEPEKAPEPKRSRKAALHSSASCASYTSYNTTSCDSASPIERMRSVTAGKKIIPPVMKEDSIDDVVKLWPASDDWALITGIEHLNNLRTIHGNVKFSRVYDISELEERWYKLLYDEKVSAAARKRMSALTPEQIFAIQTRTPFTSKEEDVLIFCGNDICKQSGLLPTIHDFANILKNHRAKFHEARTPQVLADHYKRLKRIDSIQVKQPDWDRIESSSSNIIEEVAFDFLRPLKAIRSRNHVLSGLSKLVPPFPCNGEKLNNNVIAFLRGKHIKYSMVTDGIYLGRATAENQVDVDLSIDGPAAKISRRQAFIEYDKAAGVFFIRNIGNRAMCIDSKPIAPQMSCQLKDGSLIEVMTIQIIFQIAQKVTFSPKLKRYMDSLHQQSSSSNSRRFATKK